MTFSNNSKNLLKRCSIVGFFQHNFFSDLDLQLQVCYHSPEWYTELMYQHCGTYSCTPCFIIMYTYNWTLINSAICLKKRKLWFFLDFKFIRMYGTPYSFGQIAFSYCVTFGGKLTTCITTEYQNLVDVMSISLLYQRI